MPLPGSSPDPCFDFGICEMEDRSQKTEDRRQKSEDRRQKTEVRRQKSEVRRRKTEVRSQKTEVRSQKTEDRRKKTEERTGAEIPRRQMDYTERHKFTPIGVIASFRPEGPALSRPGRQAGIGIPDRWSAEGAALLLFQVPRLRRSDLAISDPGLTTGAINHRPL